MLRRTVLGLTLAATLGATAVFAPAASAGGTAWNVSIGLPGLAINAGQPAHGAGFVGVGIGYPGYGNGYGYGYGQRPYVRPYAPAWVPPPVVPYPARIAYADPYAVAAPLPYAAPVVTVPWVVGVPPAPRVVYAPHRAYYAAPVLPPPRAALYRHY